MAHYSLYMLKGLMFFNGLREKSHSALLIYLDHLINEGKLESRYKNYFKAAKDFREGADYSYNYPKERAEEVLEYAKQFNGKIKSLMAEEDKRRPNLYF